MFSMSKIIYMACSQEEREFYDASVAEKTVPAIRIGQCCQVLRTLHVGLPVLQFYVEYLPTMAVIVDHEDCARAACRLGIPCDRIACTLAAQNRNTRLLDFLLRNACTPGHAKVVAKLIIRAGWLEGLEHLHRSGLEMSSKSLCKTAAKAGQLQCLRYLHENGYPWNHLTTRGAAWHGHLECLKYAHEAGCPWDSRLYFRAVLNDHDDCVQYAMDNGCPRPR